jgi:peptide/nickel transport system ATP-binding protein
MTVTPAAPTTAPVASNGAKPYLVVKNLVKEFPVTKGAVLQRRVGAVHAVSDVSFEVKPGETFGLVGESGCGKTTTGRMIVALEPPTSGSIVINGEDIATMSKGKLRTKRRDMQMMFQDPYASLDPRMRVVTILREPLAIQGIGNKKQQIDRCAELLNDVGLARGALERYPHEFSGGQRQRIGLARALALNPNLIVADEPVSALDVSIRSQILNMMNNLQEKYGLTYVIISHDLSVVKYMSDRIGVMYLGKMVEIGTGAELYSQPAHPYTRGLVSAIPIPDPDVERSKEMDAPKGELPSAINPPSGCRFRTRCPLAQQLCAEEEPPLRLFGPNHLAACHFPLRPPLETAAA